MDQPGDSELKRLAKIAGSYLGVFAAGALVSFGYSYNPLHDAKNWKIDYLEERIEAKDQALATLESELETLKVSDAERPDPKTFKIMQEELASTDKTIGQLESKLARAERRVKELEGARASWRAKAEKAEARVAAAAETTPSADAAHPPPAKSAPAAPTPSEQDVEMALGEAASSE